MAYVPLPGSFNTPLPTILLGSNVPGQPSGILLAIPAPFPFLPFPFGAQPSGITII